MYSRIAVKVEKKVNKYIYISVARTFRKRDDTARGKCVRVEYKLSCGKGILV